MAATHQDISEWFDYGLADGATHMIVVCDTYDYDDYPVYVTPGQSVKEEVARIEAASMQRIMEVYLLSLDKETQMKEHRAYHLE